MNAYIASKIEAEKQILAQFSEDLRANLDADTAEKAVAVLEKVMNVPLENEQFWKFIETGAFSNGAWADGALWNEMPEVAKLAGCPHNPGWTKVWANA